MLGILGGMGPRATAQFYDTFCDLVNQRGAVQDADFPPSIILNLALTGWSERGFEDRDAVRRQLIGGVIRLEMCGCSSIVIACNTVHHFHREMADAVGIPVWNMVDEAVHMARKLGCKRVGLLCSESSRNLGLYANACKALGVTPVEATDSEQAVITEAIRAVMAGEALPYDIQTVIVAMHQSGAQAILIGCTELRAVAETNFGFPILDAGAIVLSRYLTHYYQRKRDALPGYSDRLQARA